MPTAMTTRVLRRPAQSSPTIVTADICVLGAGIAGVSAALEAARLGRSVVIVDAAPSLGGQAVGSIIGTIIGLYTHGPEPYQITHGIADALIAEMTAEGSLSRRESMTGTITFQYDEVRLARWIERKVEEAGIRALVGAVLTDVGFSNRRVRHLELATRFGVVRVEAAACVDASGDATLCYQAGLEVREPEAPVFGSLNFIIEGYDTDAVKDLVIKDVHGRLAERGHHYGLVRHDGFLMHFPGKTVMLANVTHFETPLDPTAGAHMVFEGRRQADNIIRFLRAEFPRIFADARVRTYGNPGLRQTRWIVGTRQLTLDQIRSGERPPDAAAHGGSSCTMPGISSTGSASNPTTCTTFRCRAWCRVRPTTSWPQVAVWTPTSARCRRSESWGRVSRWARLPRTRSTWPAGARSTRSIRRRCRGA